MNEEEIKYLDYEGLQEFKRRLDLQILFEKQTILSEINTLNDNKVDIDDISPEVIIEDANGHEYVEIAGIKWATCNVGALNPDDDGLYFAWGETTGYEADLVGVDKDFSWNDYELTEDAGTTMSKYNSTDEKTELELTDDPVSVNMGGTWRTPTKEEWEALEESTDFEWTENYNETGISGLICTDKTNASKALFFPASGHCYNENINDVGSHGHYLSSSLGSSNITAYFMYFDSEDVNWSASGDRCNGYSVRGVLDTVQQKILGTTITDAERDYWNGKANSSDIPTKVSDLTNDAGYLTLHLSLSNYYTKSELENLISSKVDSSDLADVATSGSYNDLLNKPDIPNALVLADWSLSDSAEIDYIKNKPTNVSSFTNDAEYVTSQELSEEIEDLTLIIEDNEEVIAIALNNLNNKYSVTAVSISSNTSSSCSITGNDNSSKELLIIYRNSSGSDLVVTVPTTYVTPNGSPIELLCKNGGYCEVNYINVSGVIYARGL